MKQYLFAVRDDLTFEFATPSVFNSETEAFRAYAHYVDSYRTTVEKNPATTPIFADTKTIFYLGTYEDGYIISERTELCKLSLAPEKFKSLMAQYKGE